MSIKKYNDSKKCWEVIGSGNASDIELSNPEFSKEDGTPSSVSEAFDQLSDKLEQIEKNISYIYKNGTMGGGGGGGGGGGSSSDEIIVTNEEVSTVSGRNFLYISGNSVAVNFYVKTQGATGKYVITAKYGGKIVSGWNETTVYSSKNGSSIGTIHLDGITEEKSLEIYATSSSGIELEKYVIYVRINSYEFGLTGVSGSALEYNYEDVETEVLVYMFKDSIPNTDVTLQISLAGYVTTHTYPAAEVQSGALQTKPFNLKALFGNVAYEVGREYTLSAYIQISGAALPEPIQSPADVRTIIVKDASALVVQVTSEYLIGVENNSGGHTEDEVKNRLTQTDTLIVSIKILDNKFSSFYSAYRVLADDKTTVLYTAGNVDNPLDSLNKKLSAGVADNQIFHYSNFFIPGAASSYVGLFYLEVYVWAEGNVTDRNSVRTYIGVVDESEFIEVFDYCPNNRVVCQYNSFKHLPVPQATVWTAERDDRGSLFNGDVADFTPAQKMSVYNVNRITSGFLNNELSFVNSIPTLRLAGGAYAMIPFRPFSRMSSSNYQTILSSIYGFTISITFKSDKHPSNKGTVLDIGDYLLNSETGEYELTQGFHIGLSEVTFKYQDAGSINSIQVALVQGQLNTIDLVYEAGGGGVSPCIKIYLNGVCSAGKYFSSRDYNTINMVANSNIWFGARNVIGGTSDSGLDQKCDVNIYDFKINAEGLNPYGICRNYINARTRVELKNGTVDESLINELRSTNLMTPIKDEVTGATTLDCSICNLDGSQYVFDKSWEGVYDRLKMNSPLPIVYIELTQGGFFQTYRNIYSTTETSILDTRFSCILKYQEAFGGKELEIMSSTGEPTTAPGSGTTPQVSLQGTTTLSYAAKNLEIYLGTYDGSNNRLFTPDKPVINANGEPTGWLPENRFTLKADVVDSAHCNNAAVGKFINTSKILNDIPPQLDNRNPYARYVKHTLEGFPIYLFIKYSPNDQEAVRYFESKGFDINIPQFMGIYSFNLGRGSNFNMGFRAFKDVQFEYTDGDRGKCGVISNYIDIVQPIDDYGTGIYSYECLANDNVFGSFQCDNEIIIRKFYELKYSPDDNEGLSFNSLKILFTVLANCYMDDESAGPQYDASLDSQGNLSATPKKDANGNIIRYNQAGVYRSLDAVDRKIDYRNAIGYYLIALALGMVDSLGKNMTLRAYDITRGEDSSNSVSWKKWYTSFYDMDTCLGLNNYGVQNVPKSVYTSLFENRADENKDCNELIETRNYEGFYATGFSTYNSQLWNTITVNLMGDGNLEKEGNTFRHVWAALRSNEKQFGDPNYFMENFYNAQTVGVGEIMYNLDYQVKYFDPYDDERKDGASIGFLHGQRKEYVSDWLNDHIQFLDAAFFFNQPTEKNLQIAGSNYFSKSNVRGSGMSDETRFELGLVSPSPNIFKFEVNTESTYGYVPEEKLTWLRVRGASGETGIIFNLANILSSIQGFKSVNFSSLVGLFAPNLTEMDLSSTSGLNNPSSLGENEGSNIFVAMKELRTLDLSNMKLKDPGAGATVILSNSTKVQSINISGSDVTSIILPKGGCLETLNISRSRIQKIEVTAQPILKEISFAGCSMLQEVTIDDCGSLTSINLDGTSVHTLKISNCENITSISAKNCPQLQIVNISTLPKLTSIDLSGSSYSVANSLISEMTLEITACKEIQSLNFRSWKGEHLYLDLDSADNTKLTYLNLSSSGIYKIQTAPDNKWVPEKIGDYVVTDFRKFLGLDRLSRLNISYNTNIHYLKFSNTRIPSFIVNDRGSWVGCYYLERVFGHIEVQISAAFYFGSSRSNFRINDVATFQSALTQKSVPADGYNEQMMDQLREAWFTGENVTNITFNTSSFYAMFYNCNGVTVYDLYYLTSRARSGGTYAKQNVTNLTSFADGCDGIGSTLSFSNPLGRYTFKYCDYVTSMNGPFTHTSLNTPLFSPTRAFSSSGKYDGLFSPMKRLQNATSLFHTGSGTEIDSYLFYKIGDNEFLPIVNLSAAFGGNGAKSVVQAGHSSHTLAPLSSKEFLAYLPNLTSTEYLAHWGSGNVIFEFVTEADQNTGKYFTYFIHGNPNITSVYNTFGVESEVGNTRCIGKVTGTIFGGGLVNGTFRNAAGQSYTISNKIRNFSFFLCPKSEWNVRGSFGIDWTDMNDLFQWQTGKASFTTIKYIWGERDTSTSRPDNGINAAGEALVIGKEYTRPVTGEKFVFDFPYHVFDGMPNLTEIQGFFIDHKMQGNWQENKYASLPGDMFLDKPNLQSVDYLFSHSNENNTFVFKFTREGFKNCPNIRTARALFKNAGRLANLDGEWNGIPYKLFYHGVRDSDPIQILNQNGQNEGTFRRKILRNNISDVAYCFYGLKTMGGGSGYGVEAYQYRANLVVDNTSEKNPILDANGMCGDLIDINWNYDPRRYILSNSGKPYNPNQTITDKDGNVVENPDYNPMVENPKYSPNQYTWEEYAWDGRYREDITKKTNPLVVKYGAYSSKYINNTADYNHYHRDLSSIPEAVQTMIFPNYIFPSDVFRYCTSDCLIDFCFGYLGEYQWNSDPIPNDQLNTYRKQKLHGRVSPLLFSTLTRTSSFSGVFGGCWDAITPYNAPNGTMQGHMFHSDTFANNSGCTKIDDLFSYIRVRKNIILCEIPLFTGMGRSLTSAEKAFYYSFWDNADTYNQLNKVFANNSNLRNINELFRCRDDGYYAHYATQSPDRDYLSVVGPTYMSTDILADNTPIQYCDRAFLGMTGLRAGSKFPALWEKGTVISHLQTFARTSDTGQGIPSGWM